MANFEVLRRSRTIALLSSGHLQSPDGRVQPIVAPVCAGPHYHHAGLQNARARAGPVCTLRDGAGMISCKNRGSWAPQTGHHFPSQVSSTSHEAKSAKTNFTLCIQDHDHPVFMIILDNVWAHLSLPLTISSWVCCSIRYFLYDLPSRVAIQTHDQSAARSRDTRHMQPLQVTWIY